MASEPTKDPGAGLWEYGRHLARRVPIGVRRVMRTVVRNRGALLLIIRTARVVVSIASIIRHFYASRKLQYEAAKIIRRYRLKSHKKYAFGPGQPRVVTGVAVTSDGSQLPVKRQRSVADDFRALNAAQTPEEQLAVTPRLIGRLSGAAEIDPTWEKRKRQVVELQRSLRTKSAAIAKG